MVEEMIVLSVQKPSAAENILLECHLIPRIDLSAVAKKAGTSWVSYTTPSWKGVVAMAQFFIKKTSNSAKHFLKNNKCNHSNILPFRIELNQIFLTKRKNNKLSRFDPNNINKPSIELQLHAIALSKKFTLGIIHWTEIVHFLIVVNIFPKGAC